MQSVSIALDIIDALSDAPELSLSELARRVGVAKSTAHRTCAVLAERGLLDRTESGGYRLGLRFVEYGHIATERTAVKDRGLPLLVELRNALGETVQIGVPAGADVVYVERVEGQRALRYTTNSRRSPVHRSSAGKVLAAYHPDMVEARVKAGLTPSTGYTIVVPKLLVAELRQVRAQGFARSVDETELGLSSLAVPVTTAKDGPGDRGHLDGGTDGARHRGARGASRGDAAGGSEEARRRDRQGRVRTPSPTPPPGELAE